MPPSYDVSTGLRALQGGSQIQDIDDGFLALAQDVAKRLPTAVSSLPSSPYDGQEVYYVVNTLAGIVWHLRYRAGSTSTYKWEFVGGSPLLAWTIGATVSTNVFTDLSPLQISLPFAGDYRIFISSMIVPVSASAGSVSPIFPSITVAGPNSGAPSIGRRFSFASSFATELDPEEVDFETIATCTAANQLVKAQGRTGASSGSCSVRFDSPRMVIHPVRVI